MDCGLWLSWRLIESTEVEHGVVWKLCEGVLPGESHLGVALIGEGGQLPGAAFTTASDG